MNSCDLTFDAEIRDCVDRFNRIAGDKKDKISEKIECLKQIFDQLYIFAISEINNAI